MLPQPPLALVEVIPLASCPDRSVRQTVVFQPAHGGFADVERGAELLAVQVAHHSSTTSRTRIVFNASIAA